jgi:hypothetical protein
MVEPGQGPVAREAILAGPRLIARSPLAFVAWVLLRIVEQYLGLAILIGCRNGGQFVGAVWAVLASLPFEAVILAAILRAELQPRDKAFVFLRLGRAELRLAGILVIAGLAGVIVALPVSMGVAYIAFGLQQRLLAGSALAIGSAVAAMALMRFSPAVAMVVEGGRFDLVAAGRASKGRYWLLVLVVLAAAAIERGLGEAGREMIAPIAAVSWEGLLAPLLLASIVWRSLIGVASLAVMAGAVAVVWRRSRQTLG